VAAAGVSANLSGGVLRVYGTDGPDTIEVRSIAAHEGGREQLEVAGVGRFAAARVRSVRVESGEHDDAIHVVLETRRSRTPAVRINAGGGDDRVVVSQAGRAGGRIRILGGDGDDTIDFTLKRAKATLDGGSGWDTINGLREAGAPRVSASSPIEVALGAWEQRIVDLTNAERARAGLPPLRVSARLVEAARIQAGQMSRLDRMAHTLPDAELPSLRDRLRHVGYTSGGGENIAFNYRDPEDVLLGWMYSPSHRENILRATYREIGVAVAYSAEGLPYFVQVFGSSGG
jgi:uncharacterized protein YkwD